MRLSRQPRDLDCIEFVEIVTDYLEGALPEEDAHAFEHHVSICEGCKTHLRRPAAPPPSRFLSAAAASSSGARAGRPRSALR